MSETPAPIVEGLDRVDSTNNALRERLQAGKISRGVVWAREQTAGRGRLGRTWLSPEGGLYYSAATPAGACPPPLFGFAAGLAAYECLVARAPSISLKWPNDLLANLPEAGEHKLGGMLSEYVTEGLATPHVIVGLGININADVSLAEDSQAPASALPPISLRALTQQSHDLATLVEELTARVFAGFDALLGPDPEAAQRALCERWSQACSTLQQRVRIDAPGQRYEGLAVGIEPSFALRIQDAQGQLHIIQAGDCIHLRA